MERLPIKEAALRLRVSQDLVRERIRNGELQATRQLGPNGYFWEVELPEDYQQKEWDDILREQGQYLTPWWYPNPDKVGQIHYIASLEVEEIRPHYLCGLVSENFWDARGHAESDRCPECVAAAKAQKLPL